MYNNFNFMCEKKNTIKSLNCSLSIFLRKTSEPIAKCVTYKGINYKGNY